MTDQQHPITPSRELIQQWLDEWMTNVLPGTAPQYIATQAAQWGANQELEACCEWAAEQDRGFDLELRAARRPKPPSLSRVALLQLDVLSADLGMNNAPVDLSQIRRALEKLQELEAHD